MSTIITLAAITVFVVLLFKTFRSEKTETIKLNVETPTKLPIGETPTPINPQITDAVTIVEELPVDCATPLQPEIDPITEGLTVEEPPVVKKPRKPRTPKAKDAGTE